MTSYPHRFLVLVIATGVAVTGCAASPGTAAAPEPPPVQVYTLEHPEHRNPAGYASPGSPQDELRVSARSGLTSHRLQQAVRGEGKSGVDELVQQS